MTLLLASIAALLALLCAGLGWACCRCAAEADRRAQEMREP